MAAVNSTQRRGKIGFASKCSLPREAGSLKERFATRRPIFGIAPVVTATVRRFDVYRWRLEAEALLTGHGKRGRHSSSGLSQRCLPWRFAKSSSPRSRARTGRGAGALESLGKSALERLLASGHDALPPRGMGSGAWGGGLEGRTAEPHRPTRLRSRKGHLPLGINWEERERSLAHNTAVPTARCPRDATDAQMFGNPAVVDHALAGTAMRLKRFDPALRSPWLGSQDVHRAETTDTQSTSKARSVRRIRHEVVAPRHTYDRHELPCTRGGAYLAH